MNCARALDLVSEALDQALPPDQRIEFEEHLVECDACGRYVAQLRLSVEALKHLPPQGTPNLRRAELIEEFRKKFR